MKAFERPKIERLPPLPPTPMSTRVGEVCVVECFCCSFGDAGFKHYCMRGVRGRGLGALGMSTSVGELCVTERFVVVVLMPE